MEAQALQAEVREKRGKGPARQLRTRGLVPAIYYGPGAEPLKLAVSPAHLQKALTGPYGRNQLLELRVGTSTVLAVVRDLAIDPVTRAILHADFYGVSRDRKVRAHVPLESQGRAVGVQKGGELRALFRTLPVTASPQDVPASIVVDVSNLDLGGAVCVKDLPLPAGVEVTFPAERRVLFIDAREKKKPEEEEEAKPAAAPAATT